MSVYFPGAWTLPSYEPEDSQYSCDYGRGESILLNGSPNILNKPVSKKIFQFAIFQKAAAFSKDARAWISGASTLYAHTPCSVGCCCTISSSNLNTNRCHNMCTIKLLTIIWNNFNVCKN